MHLIRKKLSLEYEFVYNLECGLVLKPMMVKTIRLHGLSFNESFCYIDNNELFIRNLVMKNLQTTPVKLLLHRKQMNKIHGLFSQKNYIIVPAEFYEKNGRFKVLIGVGKRLKLYDQRQKIKAKEMAISDRREIIYD
jgi:SsrA-binding protein